MADSMMSNRVISTRESFPFGPHHTALLEPLHIRLILEGERISGVEFVTGYVRREIEKNICARGYKQGAVIAERTCGLCSFFHSMAYCRAVEKLKGAEIPERGKFLRTIWSELHRMQNHYFWLAMLADAIGFESLRSLILQARERIMDILTFTTGKRLILSVNIPGGVRKDITPGELTVLLTELKKLRNEINVIEKIFSRDYILMSRLCGIGILPMNESINLGVSGPAAKASGVCIDERTNDDIYKLLEFDAVMETGGDVYSRAIVRIKEIRQSIEMIRKAICKIPEGNVSVPIKGALKGEAFFRMEQPSGCLEYHMTCMGNRHINTVNIKTASENNFRCLGMLLTGNKLGDVPAILMSLGLCIGCLDK